MASVAELKEQAKGLGIKGYSKMKKDELIRAIERATQPGPESVVETVEVKAPAEIDINGMELVVDGFNINGKPCQEFLRSLKGWNHVTPAGARRRVRKWLRANGHGGLACTSV